ncbi:MAG: UDP-N-acetylmuramoyl-tripeptide--D-alanyl-D-alanine ligase [Negativicutes bacterium]|nr:UDP-N-acetylmuramoyl-tripeptide--D-alanyl-D-alanine ligase [Negativicutes bacterium]
MAEFTVDEVLSATGGELICRHAQAFSGVSVDTRTLRPGNLFVALKGDKSDGHDFLLRAVDAGATGVVISNRDVYVPDKVTAVVVTDTLAALEDLARFHRQQFAIPVIGVTGSSGKKATKDMAAAVLGSRMKVLKADTVYDPRIDLAITLLSLTKNHQAAVVEIAMGSSGEIGRLAAVAAPTMAVVTNVGEAHIELLGSVDNIAAAKAELVESLAADGLAVLNCDQPLVRAMEARTAARSVLYGFAAEASIRGENVSEGIQETTFNCVWAQGKFTVTLPAVGRHNVYSALAAVTVGLELGLHPLEICSGIRKFLPVAPRLHIEKIGDYTVINDAYCADLPAVNAAIETLATAARGRQVAVLADLPELGPAEAEACRGIGRKLADAGVQVVITVGEAARHIAAAALAEGVAVTVACADHEEAQEALRKLLRPGDTILVEALRGSNRERILELFKQ